MNRQERLKQFIDYLRITQREFADKIGVKEQYVSNMINGHKPVSFSMITKICEIWSELNFNWMMFGAGEMINPKNDTVEEPYTSYGNDLFEKTLNILNSQLQTKDNEIDRLLKIVEKLSKK